jgi:hypothetical protein
VNPFESLPHPLVLEVECSDASETLADGGGDNGRMC